MSASVDRNLLFGIIAKQLGFVTQDALLAALDTWREEKSELLSDVLCSQGRLAPDEAQHLEALVAAHLKRHGDDSQQSLASSSIDTSLRQVLRNSSDTDIRASMMQIGQDETNGPPSAAEDARDRLAGRYRVLNHHAKGGVGEVFVAQDTELGRLVALKEIQGRHAHDIEKRNRFVLEAEVTGGLEHPGIVPIYGLGHYADGRPYYAMRFIKGDNLRSALRRFHEASAGHPRFDSIEFRQLLGRFVDVCQAVAYAHSRGVLHRDLKPGNVMLGPYGETLVVDWGLAKVATQSDSSSANGEREENLVVQSGSGDSSSTQAGQVLGTPVYMPPEQAAGEWDRLGPASDVYSLGATLYELLTGKVPFESRTIEIILEDVRNGRFPQPRQVVPSAPPALEAICLKAMARNPADRYPAALDLAKEAERWLADEPVSAWPEPASLKVRRWMRRHRTAVAAAGVLLVTGVVALGILYAQSERIRDRIAAEQKNTAAALIQAEQNAETARVERDRADEENRIAQAVRDFLQKKLLSQADARTQANALVQAGRLSREAELDPRISVLLDRAAAELTPDKIELQFPNQPLVQAEILTTIGDTYRGIGKPAPAIAHLERARDLLLAHVGANHEQTLEALAKLGAAYYVSGRLPDAVRLFEQANEGLIKALGPDHPETLASSNNLARAYQLTRRLPEAIRLYEQVRDAWIAKNGPEHTDTLITLTNLGSAYQDAGRLSDAIRTLEQVRDVRIAKSGADHPLTLTALGNLAGAYRESGRLSEAIGILQQVRDLTKTKFGPVHPSSLVTTAMLAKAYRDAKRLPEAAAEYEVAASGIEQGGFQHEYARAIVADTSATYEQLKDFEKAESWRRKWLAELTKGPGPESMPYATELSGLAWNLLQQKKPVEAEAMLRQSIAIREKKEPDNWRLFNSISMLGEALIGQKRYADAEPLLLQGYEGMKRFNQSYSPPTNVASPGPGPIFPAKPPLERLTESLERLIRLNVEWDKPDAAARWRQELEQVKNAATAKPK